MRNKGFITAIVFMFLLAVVILVVSLARRASPLSPVGTSMIEESTSEIIESNTLTAQAGDQDGTSSNTVIPNQTPLSTLPANQTESVATATIPIPQDGAVSIFIDKGEYNVGEVIVVTVANNLDIPITTFTQQAFCTVIRLEVQKDGDWQEVKNCFTTEPVTEVTIDPNSTRVEQLTAFAAGTYQVGLIYSKGDAYDAGNILEISIPPFIVNR